MTGEQSIPSTGRRSTREMTVLEARHLRELEHQNTRLNKLLAEAELDKAALKDLLGRKW